MNITNFTKRCKLIAAIITLITISVLIIVSVPNRNKEYMKFLSLGATSSTDYLNMVYIKLQNEENLNDTIDVIVPIIELFNDICFHKRIDTSDSCEIQKLKKQFLKDFAYCIRNDKPMIVSPDVFDEFNYEKAIVVIDETIEREFNLNGHEHYIDEEGYLKGTKSTIFDTIIPNLRLDDSASINRFNNLIYLFQKERIGVYFAYDEATNYWGYLVWK